MKKKVYISVPMTGREPEDIRADIEVAEEFIRRKGGEPVNPYDCIKTVDQPWIDCLLDDLSALKACGGILMMPGWRKSCGCRMEYFAARGMRLEIEIYRNNLSSI